MAITDRLLMSVGAEPVFRDMGFNLDGIKSEGMVLCAFHDDGRNPSCSIDLSRGIFHCFGCGKEGDLVRGWGLAKGIDFGPDLFKAIEERFLGNGHALPSVPPAPRLPTPVANDPALDAHLDTTLAMAEAVTVQPDICALYEVRKYKTSRATGLLYGVRDPSTGLLCDIKRRQLSPLPDPRFKSVSAMPFCSLCKDDRPRAHPCHKDHAPHILRAHAGLFGYRALLSYPDHLPLLCAGEKDALRGATALLPFGIVPISWSAGEASDPEGLAPLLKGRPCVLLYDADAAGTREAPLREAYLRSQGVAATVFPWSSVPPPALVAGQKDLFDWLKAGGSPEALAAALKGLPAPSIDPANLPPPPAPKAAKEAPKPAPKAPPPPEEEAGASMLDMDDPLGAAGHFVLDRHYDNGNTLLRWRGDFWSWRKTHFVNIEDEAVVTGLYGFLRDNGEVPNDKKVNRVLHALKAGTYTDQAIAPPTFLHKSDAYPTDRLIAFKNCLFDPITSKTYPHTPTYFNHSSLPFDYDPNAAPPIEWLSFLNSLWRDDPDTIDLLQEIFGYLIGPDTHLQKFFYLYGSPGSGKGTVGRVLRHILGPENVGAQQLASFEQNFGMQDLIGKTAAILDDVRWSAKADNARITERILSISGEGAITIDRKNRDPWTGMLGTRLVFISNELIKLPDVASALSRRNIPVHFRKSFMGREDTRLSGKLYAEATGIINWAMAGRLRLMDRGAFMMKGTSAALHARFEASTNPLRRFQTDCCEFVEGDGDTVPTVYAIYLKWCEDAGVEHPMTMQDFENKMQDSSPMIEVQFDKVARRRYFKGLSLAQDGLSLLYRNDASGGGRPSYTPGA